MNQIKYNKNEEPIILSKPLLDLLLSQQKPANLIALYSFYYYTAKWQQTNTPKCSTYYVTKGLNMGEHKVRTNKKILIDLGLISNYVKRDEQNKITGHYIKVNFIWSKATLTEIHRVENNKGNALSTNNKNTSKEVYLTSDSGGDQNTPLIPSMRKLNITSEEEPKKMHEPHHLVEYWNGLPNVRKHKEPSSRIYQECKNLLIQFKRGTFNGSHPFSPEWYNTHLSHIHAKIPKEGEGDGTVTLVGLGSLTEGQIREGMAYLSQMQTEGYWPHDKKWLQNKSLKYFLYNPISRTSWFLALLEKPPEPLSKTYSDFHSTKLDPILFTTTIEFLGGSFAPSRRIGLIRSWLGVVKFYDGLPKGVFKYGIFGDECPQASDFCLHYLEYLRRLPNVQPGINMLSVEGHFFRQYLDSHWTHSTNAMDAPLSSFL